MSVVRAYDLLTGQRRVVAEGGSTHTFLYGPPAVSGSQVVFEKALPDSGSGPSAQPHIQIMLADMVTGRVRPLTPANEANSEPSISGHYVVWKRGARFTNGAGAEVEDLRTGRRTVLVTDVVEGPKVTAGRYVVFSHGLNLPRVELYDLHMQGHMTLAAPRADGTGPGHGVKVSGRTILYSRNKSQTTSTPLPFHEVVTLLP